MIFFQDLKDSIESAFVNKVAPVGHGPVLSYPDRPYLKWQYVDWKDDTIIRDNPKDYMDAVDHMYAAMKAFISGDSKASFIPMHREDRDKIEQIIRENDNEDGECRHKIWLDEIRKGVQLRLLKRCPTMPLGRIAGVIKFSLRSAWKRL